MAAVFFLKREPTEGTWQPNESDDELTLGKINLNGVLGVALDAGGATIENLGAPVNDSDAATKGYTLGLVQGLDTKESCRAGTTPGEPLTGWIAGGSGVGATLTSPDNTLANNDLDGVTLVVGNRVLVKNFATASDNGIYEVTQVADGASVPAILTRALDFDQDAEVTANAYTWISEGTTNADTGWTLTSNDPITVDTTDQTWAQFNGAGSIVAGLGLAKAGNTLSLDFDTDADAQSAGFGGGSSGLETDVSGDAGQARVKVSATGAIQRAADGIGVLINDTPDTLDQDASGLRVVGLPSLFKINDVNTGATVTAANLDTLTDGSSADGLHDHSFFGVPFTVGTGGVTLGDALDLSSANTVTTADISLLGTSHVVGLARTTEAAAGTVTAQKMGILAGALSGATAGDYYYAGPAGSPVLYAAIPLLSRILSIGIAVNATDLDVAIDDKGIK